MDPDLFRSIVTGLGSGVGAVGLLTFILKGDKVVLARERVDGLKAKDEVIALKDRDVARLQEANEELQNELKAANATVTDLAKQTLSAIAVLDRMSALAAQERRRSTRNE